MRLTLLLTLCSLFAAPAFALEAPDGVGTKNVGIVAPTENVDGSPITDLAAVILMDCQGAGCTPSSNAQTIPASAGQTVSDDHVVTVVGNVGDTITVRYGATAVDANANESALSNIIEEQFLITDTGVPQPPSIQFTVPVTYGCMTPEGGGCSLERII